MGQYLMIGLLTKVVIDKKEVSQNKQTVEEVIRRLEQEKGLCTKLYLREDEEDEAVLTLNPTLFQQGLLPFLTDFYQARYFANDNKSDAEQVLLALTEAPPDQWMKIADRRRYKSYQVESFMHYDYLRVDAFRNIRYRSSHILLSMDGKIIMECYDSLFRFLENSLKQQFAKHALAQTIEVYISD